MNSNQNEHTNPPPGDTLTAEQKQQVLQIARTAVEQYVRTGQTTPGSIPAILDEPRGAFVTLHDIRGNLRGCIGTFVADKPLGPTIYQMAVNACQDPRFVNQRLTPDELSGLIIEVSVLSALVPTDDALSLIPGVHGIYIRKGMHSGCFLPQVATEMNWSAEQFLSYCCSHKAGLPANAWQDKDTQVFLFTAEVFSESAT